MNENLPIETPTEQGQKSSPLLLGAAVVAGAALLNAPKAQAASPALTYGEVPGTGDIKVLNYALLLEALETELYVQAVQRLTTGGTGGEDAAAGTNIPGLGITANSSPTGNTVDLNYYLEFRAVELAHRNFLRSALGGAAIPANAFKFDFGMATKTRRQVLDLVLLAEATGVKAYLGAIPFFVTRTYVQTAAAIQGTEARHTTVMTLANNILVNNGTLSGTIMDVAPLANQSDGRDATLQPPQVITAVQGFIVRNVA
jgi:hypothetical protein